MNPRSARAVLADEQGLSTAELLGNAALAIGALTAIWLAMKGLGVEVVDYIRGAVLGGQGG